MNHGRPRGRRSRHLPQNRPATRARLRGKNRPARVKASGAGRRLSFGQNRPATRANGRGRAAPGCSPGSGGRGNHAGEGSLFIFNEIGVFQGETLADEMPAGDYLLYVQADGPWTIKIAP